MLSAMKKTLALFSAALVLLAGFALARTAGYRSDQPAVDPAPHIALREGAAERLAGSIRIPTISHEDPAAFDAEAFRALHAYLQAAFPRVHSQLRRETVQTHSLLYTWHGSDSSLKPILLMGHLDVVPVEPGTEGKWQQEPFGGRCPRGWRVQRASSSTESVRSSRSLSVSCSRTSGSPVRW